MMRSAALCLLLAAAILPDLAAAQTTQTPNSEWNPTDLEDALFLGIVIGASVLFLIILFIIALCCCCFLCPGLFGNCCGPRYAEEPPYFEPPPPQYYPEPERNYPMVVSQPPPEPEPVYIMKSDPEPRRERVYVVRDRHDRDRDRDRYDNHDYDRRVIIRQSSGSRYDRGYGDMNRGYGDMNRGYGDMNRGYHDDRGSRSYMPRSDYY